MAQKAKQPLPPLPLEAWEAGKTTLHLMLQIIGKIRLKVMPRKNHWWYITEYISPRGITTQGMPYRDGSDLFEITLDLLAHRLEVDTSQGERTGFSLSGISVADFYRQLFGQLDQLGVGVQIVDRPFDMGIDLPFSALSDHRYQQEEYLQRFWRILLWVDGVFKEFSGRYYGKTCPVHLYWHHMDLTVTRFSGRPGPPLGEDWRLSDKDAYTHEVISFGFWAGDETVREPAFYAYTYPSPERIDEQPLRPPAAQWIDSNGSPMAFLRYEDLRQRPDPRQELLDFLESSYQAGARLANWDIEGNRVPPLKAL